MYNTHAATHAAAHATSHAAAIHHATTYYNATAHAAHLFLHFFVDVSHFAATYLKGSGCCLGASLNSYWLGLWLNDR